MVSKENGLELKQILPVGQKTQSETVLGGQCFVLLFIFQPLVEV